MQWSDVEPMMLQFLYFSFFKKIVNSFVDDLYEFWKFVVLYVELSWIVVECVGSDYIVACFGGSPSREATKISSSKKA
jgi:hypothetical protein